MDNKPVKPGASPHGQAVIPQLSPEMLNRLLETQAREIELRTKQLALQQQQDSNNFEFAKLALEAKTKDRQESRTFGALTEAPPPAFNLERVLTEIRNTPPGLTTGWDALDRHQVRFLSGSVSVLAARTSHGKTSAMVNVLLHWLKEHPDKTFVFFSHEEAESCIIPRMLAILTRELSSYEDGWSFGEIWGYTENPVLPGGWPDPDLLEEAKKIALGWEDRLHVLWCPRWTAADIDAHARMLARKGPISGILADYIQRIPSPERMDRRDIEVSVTTRTLKTLAVDLNIPVVAGAQMNREAIPKDYREKLLNAANYEAALQEIRKARPELHHLREGGIEQEADLVLGLLCYSADIRTDEGGLSGDQKENQIEVPDVTPMEIGTLKHRYGRVGRWAVLGYEGRYQYIRDVQGEEEAKALRVPWSPRASALRAPGFLSRI